MDFTIIRRNVSPSPGVPANPPGRSPGAPRP
jgi:hypothetical protein